MAESYSVIAYLKAHDANFSKQFDKAQSTVSKFKTNVGKTMANVGKIVATATKVAGTALVAFGGYGIKSAADMRVIEAQYEQAFNGVSSEADGMVESMSNSFNMLPERLKAPMSSFQSYFKGTGMEVNKSLSATEKAMTIAADSSAYYDKSIEDTSASLKGFLLGNFENGDAIGINTNLTKIGQKYNEKYGGSFDDLSESQKQNYLLEYVEDIYKLNGVMGQGTREGHEFENVFANLRSTVATFAGKVMEPFMDPLIAAMEKASGWISTADEKFFAFVETIKNSTAFQSLQQVVQMAMDKITEFGNSESFSKIKQAFSDLGQAILDIDFVAVIESVGAFLDKWGPLIAGVLVGIKAFQLISAVVTIVTPIITALSAAGGILAVVIGFLTSPIFLAAAAIGALVAIGITLWKNWDTIKIKASELWQNVKEKFNQLKESVSTAIENAKIAVSNKFNEMKTATVNKAQELKQGAINKFNEMKTGASNAVQNAKNAISNKFSEIKNAVVNKAQELKTGAINKFNEMKNGASNKVQEAKNAVSQKFQEIVNSVRDKMNDAVGKVKEIGGGIKDFFEGIDLYASGKAIIQSAIDGLVAMKDKITGKVSEIAGAVRDFWPFSPAKTGPLSDIHKMDFAGPIGTSVDKARKPLNKAMESLASSARSGFESDWNSNALNISRTARNLNGSVSQTVSQNVNLNDGALIDSLNKLTNKQSDIYLDGETLVGGTYDRYDRVGGNTTKLSQRWGR